MDLKDTLASLIKSAEQVIAGEQKETENALRAALGLPDAATAADVAEKAQKRDAETNELANEADRLLDEYRKQTARAHYWDVKPRNSPAGRTILDEAAPRLQVAVARRVYSRTGSTPGQFDTLKTALFAKNLPYAAEDLESLLQSAAASVRASYYVFNDTALLRHVRRFQEQGGTLTPAMTKALEKLHHHVTKSRYAAGYDVYRKAATTIEDILGLSSASRPDPKVCSQSSQMMAAAR